MKVFICVALLVAAVCAEPEADPNLVYKHGNFHTNVANIQKGIHRQYAGVPGSVYQTVPVTTGYPGSSPVGYRQTYAGVPAYQQTYAGVPAVYSGSPVYQQRLIKPVVYKTSPFMHSLFKREADAESQPEAEAEADPYLFYGNNLGYRTYAHGYVPQVYSPVTYGRPAYQYKSAYAGFYNPNQYFGGRLFKRDAEAESEAEPEADPFLLYNTHAAYSPYTAYGHFPTAGYQTYANIPSVYNYNAYTPYKTYTYGNWY